MKQVRGSDIVGAVRTPVGVGKPGKSLSAEDIIAFACGRLARYKVPKQIEFVEALPRNATGKIHKPTLREKFNAVKATDRVAS